MTCVFNMTVDRREAGPVLFPELKQVPSFRQGRERFVPILLGRGRCECGLTAGEPVHIAGRAGDTL